MRREYFDRFTERLLYLCLGNEPTRAACGRVVDRLQKFLRRHAGSDGDQQFNVALRRGALRFCVSNHLLFLYSFYIAVFQLCALSFFVFAIFFYSSSFFHSFLSDLFLRSISYNNSVKHRTKQIVSLHWRIETNGSLFQFACFTFLCVNQIHTTDLVSIKNRL